MRGIYKRFGDVVASKHVDFELGANEIHALLGENGAGKTTLMRILYGLYQADEGEIRVEGNPVSIRSPRDAIRYGIGMVTQHFALVPPLTVAENVVLGYTPTFRLDQKAAREQVARAAAEYGLEIDPAARVSDLSVGQRQRVEILKALYRQARVLILDEPTAVLVPQEADQLFQTLRRLQSQGLSVIFISHKLYEVLEICSRITILRDGTRVDTVEAARTDQRELARLMVGRPTLGITNPRATKAGDERLSVAGLTLRFEDEPPLLDSVTFTVKDGEILGLAGVSGNGQRELAQILDGTRQPSGGSIRVDGIELAGADPGRLMQAGIGRIPEDRHESVVAELSVADNMVLEHLDEFTRRGTLDRRRIRNHVERLIEAYQIKAQPDDRIRTLSGGNMQKVILARVLERNPRVLIVSQPTRGLDVGATEYVRTRLIEERDRGAAVLLISEDLDEILELSDRIAVIYEGRLMGILPVGQANPERLGLLMSGVNHDAH